MDKQVDEAMANGLGDGERLVANTLTDTRSRSMLDKLRAEEMARITSQAQEENRDPDGSLRVVINGVNPPVERQNDLIEAAGGLAIETALAIVSGAAAAVVSRFTGFTPTLLAENFGLRRASELAKRRHRSSRSA